ncbi:hypothetical protein [Pseudanabaena mucicola]|uniref:Uncharacterized protein n=1 Tax=Pseudanabaena mucicola FACHB-723 TaxID=2692860 RepID=A0ABR8A0H9_9CYAN|nr:hypothetical protein [Pseudanabaena mucicola]MBD2189498.1 hypothetical protein [Pseudanabaena mucicola FACHB-723]MBD2189972.1 hypothetical protein [Pseudanabaena mucicola FACHB-723]
MIILKSILVWLVFILAESLNGTARIFWLIPLLGESLAHQISFAIGSLLIVTIATLFIRWLQVSKFMQLLSIGLIWLLLTVLFEIGLGRFVLAYSWEQIAADYNLLQGGLMPIGLVLLVLSPFIAAKIRRVSLQISS